MEYASVPWFASSIAAVAMDPWSRPEYIVGSVMYPMSEVSAMLRRMATIALRDIVFDQSHRARAMPTAKVSAPKAISGW